MLNLRKISQDISENTCKWIPLVLLDRQWSENYISIDLGVKKLLSIYDPLGQLYIILGNYLTSINY